ncbi:T9SS C-terminal target domain-containing protein [candidate division KSB1 bacterium]|nr:MAG: T9SS C-terminal target domain-containing protein [candidate division KSB1 bacterium]
MKRGWLAVVLLLISVYESHADTTWVQGGSVSGNWTAEHSPYMIQGDVMVAAGDSLRINPGVVVYFAAPCSLTVNGKLLAVGTETDSIRFTTDTLANPGRWKGLRFINADSASRMEYCIVEYGYLPEMDTGRGGGIYCENTSCRFSHCLLRYNYAWFGGGVYVYHGSPTFNDCKIMFNYGLTCGGLALDGADANILSCRIDCNTSGASGAGIFMLNYSAPYLEYTTVSFNHNGNIVSNGEGIFCSSSAPTIIHCALVANHPRGWAGSASAMYLYESLAIVTSTIFAFNFGEAILIRNSTARVRYCDFYGQSWSSLPDDLGIITGTNANGDSCDSHYNILLDPQLADTAARDLHLLPISPCINAGDPALPHDPDGSVADIGAFPFYLQAGPTHVTGGNVSGRWTQWGSPYRIEGNVTVALGDSLRINPGVIVDFAAPYSLTIHGKLLARGTASDSIKFTMDTLAYFDRWRGLHFINSDNTSRMEYCIVEYGSAQGTEEAGFGGGIYCDGTSATFAHCLIRHNGARYGGGVFVTGAAPVFNHCRFMQNNANIYGGGLVLFDTDARLLSCRVDGNTSFGSGAGILISGFSAPYLEFTTISYNRSLGDHHYGAGIYCTHSDPSVIRCSIIGNSATPPGLFGTGMYVLESQAVINSTIFAFNNGPALFFWDSTQIQANYCDFYGQEVAGGSPPTGFGVLSATNANADSCDSYHNILLDPQFIDTTARDFHLQPTSPCIHAGDPNLPHDPDETVADIGAFYYHRPYFPPTPFALLSPQNGDTLIDTNRVRFSWENSQDGDRGDTVTFALFLHSGDSTWTFPVFVDSQHIVDLSALSLDITEPMEWWVTAHSPRPDTSIECQERFIAHLVSAGAMVPENSLPREFALYESYPNPFNAVTAIRFDVPRASRVKLIVFDLLGREVAVLQDRFMEAGSHRVLFDAGALTSGVYFCRMTADDFTAVKKLLLVK